VGLEKKDQSIDEDAKQRRITVVTIAKNYNKIVLRKKMLHKID
jgi:hypothetical protein